MLDYTVSSKIKLALPRPELDGPVLFDLLNQHRTSFEYYLPWIQFTQKPEDEISFLKLTNQHFGNAESLNLVIWYQEKIAGMISFNSINKIRNSADIGYWLTPEYRGHGVVTQSVQAICKIGFEDYGLNKIIIQAAVDNVSSNAVAKRAGFILEGISRQNEKLADGYHDENVYSLLRSDQNKV